MSKLAMVRMTYRDDEGVEWLVGHFDFSDPDDCVRENERHERTLETHGNVYSEGYDTQGRLVIAQEVVTAEDGTRCGTVLRMCGGELLEI